VCGSVLNLKRTIIRLIDYVDDIEEVSLINNDDIEKVVVLLLRKSNLIKSHPKKKKKSFI
jgi:hypothetical protein